MREVNYEGTKQQEREQEQHNRNTPAIENNPHICFDAFGCVWRVVGRVVGQHLTGGIARIGYSRETR